MLLLLIFSFIAGVVTILSPCILPVLPIVLSSSLGKGKERPLGIVAGFILSFTFFTLFLTTIVKFFGIPADSLRLFSVFVIFLFGLSLLLPQIQKILERSFSYFSRFVPRNEKKQGFGGGFIIGISIGLLWTPCVGPILASVISLALTGSVSFEAFLITLSYSLGTAIPMLIIVYYGQKVLTNVPWLLKNTVRIQKVFAVVMMLTALAILFNFDRKFQAFILEKFPNYGVGLIKWEENEKVKERLKDLSADPNEADMGKTTADLLEKSFLAPELIPGGTWFNLPPDKDKITLSELKGKVVLIDFWTYTCINCIRTLPYVKSWHEKYTDSGLVIIGVHTPEFEFEKNPQNVQKAVNDFGIKYIVMQDNNYATWNAYNNRYWPAKYLIGRDGKIRYTHFGEGEYDKTEGVIQSLLKEGGEEINMPINNPPYQIQSRTPELYLGYARIQYFASPEKAVWDKLVSYTKPQSLPNNYFAFEGEWLLSPEYAAPNKGSRLYLNFEAREVFLVVRPKGGRPGNFEVKLNGSSVGAGVEGQDVTNGMVRVEAERLYKIIKLVSPGRNELRLDFLDDNLELYAFTFG